MSQIVNDFLQQLQEVNTEIQHRINQNNFDTVIALLDKRSNIVSKFLQNKAVDEEDKVECIISIRDQDQVIMQNLKEEREKSRDSILSFKRLKNYFNNSTP